eukprot:3636845-Rhodomonas_salina.1
MLSPLPSLSLSLPFTPTNQPPVNILLISLFPQVLSDLTGLKPPLLPEDNPADLSYFFDDDYHKR